MCNIRSITGYPRKIFNDSRIRGIKKELECRTTEKLRFEDIIMLFDSINTFFGSQNIMPEANKVWVMAESANLKQAIFQLEIKSKAMGRIRGMA